MAVLVTGGAGFVGLNIVEALLGRGEAVVVFGLDDPPEAARRAFGVLPGNLTTMRGDVRDADAVERAMAEHAVERVVHAAVITAGIERERTDYRDILDVNLRGAAAVLDAARRRGVRRLVYPSSGAVYGESLHAAERLSVERTPAVPVSLYAITKYAAERMCLRLGDLWGVDVICGRLGSVFGPWERDTGVRDTLSPFFQLARAAARGETAVLPRRRPRRDWVYSRDIAGAIVALLDAPPPVRRVCNVASGHDPADHLPAFADALRDVYPRFSWRVAGERERATVALHDERDRAPPCVRPLTEEFGYAPRFTSEAALADFAAWLASHPDFPLC